MAEQSDSSQSRPLSAPQILDVLITAEDISKKAAKHNHPLTGGGFYASKFSEAQAEATLALRKLSGKLDSFEDAALKDALKEIGSILARFFDPKAKQSQRGELRKRVIFLYKTVIDPAMTISPTHAPSDDFFPLEIVRDTRGYIERVAEQACGSYDQGWYDAAAVMARRLLETLIIETFEAYKVDDKIKNPDGTFYYLSGLIPMLLNEKSWNITRNIRSSLPKLKDLGDQSAHNRRYLARKGDLDNIKRDLRITLEELVNVSKLKK
ncbi:MAG TPA: hypothetical protein PK595_03695 [Bacteroidota bacterium]|nr:hypothetical protein [Bacteroidota bacterium]